MKDTDCRKCKAPMPLPNPGSLRAFAPTRFKVTAYACEKCGHWNDLKRRKANHPTAAGEKAE